MPAKIRHIILSGELGERFGRDWHLAVNTPGEALRAIEVNKPGLFAHLNSSAERGVGYRVLVGDYTVEKPEELAHPIGRAETLQFVPVIAGAFGNSGLGSILLGAALIAFAGPLSVGFVTTTGLSISASFFPTIGLGLILGGVSQMLTRTPSAPSAAAYERPENKPNDYFDGPVNTTVQGGAVPIAFGEILAGSYVISSGIYVR